MSPERWQKVREIFDQAAECEPAEAERVLRAACGADSGLYDEVRRMLAQHERSSPLDRAVWDEATLGVFHAGQTVAGRYRVVRYLNRGGMGEVYEARDLELGERVALKTLLPDVAADARMIARFKQEIQLSRKIGHPNVCRVFDLAREPADGSSPDTVFFLTMEFLDGETLAARLEREGRMTTAQALPLIEQMAQALDAAHAAGVIHRDFKPSNVMLTAAKESAPGRAVVTDFGLARSHTPGGESTGSLSGRVMGTVDYMSPELLEGKPAAFASDIYALGMVAYKMVTGALPFASDTPLAGAILRSKEPIPSPKAFVPGLDPRWGRAILRALDADPARRFRTAADFVRALRGESTAITLALPVMNRRKWIGIAAAVLALVGAGVGWRTWENARRRPGPEAEMLYRQGVDDISAGAYFAATKAFEKAGKVAPHFALARARLAEAWVGLDMPEKAQEEMLYVRREDMSALSKLERLQIEAIDLTITREFSAAAAKYEAIAKLSGAGSADVWMDLGRVYEQWGKPDQAVENYKRAAEGPAHTPAAWLRLAVRYSRQSNQAKADEAFRQAEAIYQLSSNLEGLTEVTFQRGIAANRRGHWAEGAAFLRGALDTAHMDGNLQREISIKLELATNAYRSGDAGEAERLSAEALATARENQMERLAIAGLVNMGNACSIKPDRDGAERYYQEALSMARRNSSQRFVALSLFSLASLHEQEKRPDDAVREASEALGFFEPNRWVQETFLCRTVISRAEEARGNYQAQLESAERLMAGVTRTNTSNLLGTAHESIAAALFNLGRYPEALEDFSQTLALSTDAPHIAYAALESGETLSALGRFGEAGEMFTKAEALAGGNPVVKERASEGRAEVAVRQGQFAKAESIIRSALASDPKEDTRGPVEFKRILGLALVGQGKKHQGALACRQALDALFGQHRPVALLRAQLAFAQASLETDRKVALDLLTSLLPGLGNQTEARWRVLAMLASHDDRYRSQAEEAFSGLLRQWGQAAVRQYVRRADLLPIARPFLGALSAER